MHMGGGVLVLYTSKRCVLPPCLFLAQDVCFRVWAQNIPQVSVKVYQVDASLYYRKKQSQVELSIETQGLEPKYESTYQMTQSEGGRDPDPLRVLDETITVPELRGRCVEFLFSPLQA